MKFAVVAASAALLASSVDAHGLILKPAAKFKPGVMNTNYNALIDSSTMPAPFAGKKFNGDPAGNVAAFTEAFKASTYKNIKTLMDASVADCGNTLTDGTPVDVSSMSTMEWENDYEKKGFVTSHTGPCEVWIDNKMIMHEDNCVGKFTGYPASIPVDYSSCKGKCQLTFYWLALHEPKWQVYKQCVPIQNGAGGGSAPSPSADTPAAPSPNTPSAPSPDTPSTTKKPSASKAPSPSKGASGDSPVAPLPSKKACKRRRALRNE